MTSLISRRTLWMSSSWTHSTLPTSTAMWIGARPSSVHTSFSWLQDQKDREYFMAWNYGFTLHKLKRNSPLHNTRHLYSNQANLLMSIQQRHLKPHALEPCVLTTWLWQIPSFCIFFAINSYAACWQLIFPTQNDAKKLKNDWSPGKWVLTWE